MVAIFAYLWAIYAAILRNQLSNIINNPKKTTHYGAISIARKKNQPI
jgi:hypothetical protein